MTNSEMMSIGAFADACGLTTSALRFYDDAGLLRPDRVDPGSGYRWYTPGQCDRAVLVRRLREIGMPIVGVRKMLDSAPLDAKRCLDDYLAEIIGAAEAARSTASLIKAQWDIQPEPGVTTISGAMFAAATDQVLTTTACDAEFAVLSGVRVEIENGALTMSATDRFRLTTRSLVAGQTGATCAGTVHADDLRRCLADLRHSPVVELTVDDDGLTITLPGGRRRHCRLIDDTFPDHRALLGALPTPTTTMLTSRTGLLDALERGPAEFVEMQIDEGRIALRPYPCPSDDDSDSGTAELGDEMRLVAEVTGVALTLWFEMTTLYPAISTAIGADVLVELRGRDQPATIRSADRGELTTLVMPVRNPASAGRVAS
ncbi:MerR family transcriptional regulator [Gordonia polyisoprenivorans]|uniref:MerR family transcriptional regulator n=1 Tax=Gordonia polyisoprenivorans TaxID=84595 RepID=A0A846WLB9_9ACTN|nr:MerR family transcriptional regulator [Gordonia polyisoprenivorans]NKY02442.1 MerR family transcriptional regulator [Gordonia polyisoprenivorans]